MLKSGRKSEMAMKGWYEVRGEELYIWEGVLVMHSIGSSCFQFFKIMDGDIFEIHVELTETPISSLKSDGYWQCAEIRGALSTGHHFLCHSLDAEHAFKILKVLPSAITRISIRLDPNPLRNWQEAQIEERLQNWRRLAKQMCEFPEDSRIILDSEMLW